MARRNFHVPDHFDEFIDAVINSGRYDNASDVVGGCLRLLERRELEDEAKIAWLRTAAAEAFTCLDRGEAIRYESMDELAADIARISDEGR